MISDHSDHADSDVDAAGVTQLLRTTTAPPARPSTSMPKRTPAGPKLSTPADVTIAMARSRWQKLCNSAPPGSALSGSPSAPASTSSNPPGPKPRACAHAPQRQRRSAGASAPATAASDADGNCPQRAGGGGTAPGVFTGLLRHGFGAAMSLLVVLLALSAASSPAVRGTLRHALTRTPRRPDTTNAIDAFAPSYAASSASRAIGHAAAPSGARAHHSTTTQRQSHWRGLPLGAASSVASAVAGTFSRWTLAHNGHAHNYNRGGGGGGALTARAMAGAGAGAAAAGAAELGGGEDHEWRSDARVRAISIVSDGAPSPYRTSWDALVSHTADRMEWTDPSYQMMVFKDKQLGADAGARAAFERALSGGAQLVVGIDVSDPAAVEYLQGPSVSGKLPGVAVFVGGAAGLARELTQLPGLRPLASNPLVDALAKHLPWSPMGRSAAVWSTLQVLLSRHNSDDFLFVYLVLVNEYVTTVPLVADSTKGFDLPSLVCMIKNCGSKVVACVQDPNCKGALDCLNACTFNDQVCQYRCIVSHESPLLEQFSLCILQLHNCRNLDAKPPAKPDPSPMTQFRGQDLSHEDAEDLFIGWLDQAGQGAPPGRHLQQRPGLRYSWLVAAGKNPAYDYFPCQHQLYYRGKGKGQMWYEPVFKAITLDGREVWRRRVYRVKRAKVPGTFQLSVLDNGVTSNEFWRILDCADDLAFCLFYYSGAASTAGLSYSGAVLGTPDGRMPGAEHLPRLQAALRRAGIEMWELSYVDNSNCGDAPLQITGPAPAPAPV